MEMDLEVIEKFLTENKEKPEVAEFLVKISVDKPLNPEVVAAYLQTKEGKDIIDPMIDSRVNQAVKTHDEKSKPKIDAAIKAGIAAEMMRLNPQETPEQKRLRELEEKDRQRDKMWEEEKLKTKIKERSFKEGIDPEFIDGVPFPSEEEATLYMQRLKNYVSKEVDKRTNELLATSYKPKVGKEDDNKVNLNSLKELSMDELVKMEKEGKLNSAFS